MNKIKNCAVCSLKSSTYIKLYFSYIVAFSMLLDYLHLKIICVASLKSGKMIKLWNYDNTLFIK